MHLRAPQNSLLFMDMLLEGLFHGKTESSFFHLNSRNFGKII